MIYKNADLLDATEDAIGHGCNVKKTMGAGVALALRMKWPIVYQTDKNYDNFIGAEKIGRFSTTQLWSNSLSRYIQLYNIYTQIDFKPRGLDHFQYEGFSLGLERVFWHMQDNGLHSIALPKIGSGLAGGDWDRISKIIEGLENGWNKKVVIYEPQRR